MFDWQPVWLSLELASISTLILLCLGTPLAWWLSQSHHWSKQIINALVTLPLVLPPTVLGFYLLLLLGPQGAVGQLLVQLGLDSLAFSFPGLIFASVIYSLPFVVQPLQSAFAAQGRSILEAAATLRAKPLDRFFSIVVPSCRAGFISAAVLSFAHTLGEFGVILMVGGSIPGETKVLSVAIYEHVEALEYTQAHLLSTGLLLFSFLALLVLYRINGRSSYGALADG